MQTQKAAELVCSAVSYRPATRCRSYRLPVSTTATAVFATAAMRCATSMSTTCNNDIELFFYYFRHG